MRSGGLATKQSGHTRRRGVGSYRTSSGMEVNEAVGRLELGYARRRRFEFT